MSLPPHADEMLSQMRQVLETLEVERKALIEALRVQEVQAKRILELEAAADHEHGLRNREMGAMSSQADMWAKRSEEHEREVERLRLALQDAERHLAMVRGRNAELKSCDGGLARVAKALGYIEDEDNQVSVDRILVHVERLAADERRVTDEKAKPAGLPCYCGLPLGHEGRHRTSESKDSPYVAVRCIATCVRERLHTGACRDAEGYWHNPQVNLEAPRCSHGRPWHNCRMLHECQHDHPLGSYCSRCSGASEERS